MDNSIRILVVDDFPAMRRIIKNVLKQLELKNIAEADDGKSAMVQIEKDKFDLIISDWNMPGMTGIDLLRKVRELDDHGNTPFLMVTAEGQKEKVIEAIQSGVSNYIVKPFTPEQMKEKIEKIMG